MIKVEKSLMLNKKNSPMPPFIKLSLLIVSFLAIIFFYCYGPLFFSPYFSLSKTTFSRLPSWDQDDQRQAVLAFQKSCSDILQRDPQLAFSSLAQAKKNQDWQRICRAAMRLSHPNKKTAQQFFEFWFEPYTIKDRFNAQGLFTGYYLPLLHGSLKKNKKYTAPIYGLPTDLIKVNLELFHPEWVNKTLIGQLKNNSLVPYPDRAAINNGALGKNAPILVWIDNAADVFFAQIQGSALVQLPHHPPLLIGYAGTNGRAYTAVGKILIENKAISKKNMSMQAIRDWLTHHPKQMNDFLNQDASYVFFTLLKTKAPLGTEQIPLTPQRSLAVDKHYLPLGAPLWLETKVPEEERKKEKWTAYRRLLIAQDTGGAIKGIVRGDIYWGAGKKAAFSAGHMKQTGRYWILLPKSPAP
ncbi:MAG: rane-bound lytic murein transglycosylase [Gammaproteobacteria bacterium]|jgi:membrane-bound lytic murein transglycosylase A|nr:rane-bound lytic murein transglycosylase [Gammaproteobacteria bacterium]